MAFNIDVELGPDPGSGGYKIYCSSLTKEWEVIKTANDISKFHNKLINDNTAKKGPLPNAPDFQNMNSVCIYLSKIGCTAESLRSSVLHDFLNIPQDVRSGLRYASEKSFGEIIKESYMQLQSQKVRRGGGKRYVKLARDKKRGGTIVLFLRENDSRHVASLKIGTSTIMKTLPNVENGILIRSGKRNWLLQASNENDYRDWLQNINKILESVGASLIELPKQLENENSKHIAVRASQSYKSIKSIRSNRSVKSNKSIRSNNTNNYDEKTEEIDLLTPSQPINNTSNVSRQSVSHLLDRYNSMNEYEPDEIEQKHLELEEKNEQLKQQLEDMEERVKELDKYVKEWEFGKQELQKKFQKEIDEEKKKIRQKYAIEIENLNNYLADTKRLLKSKSSIKHVGSTKKKKNKKNDKEEYKLEDGDPEFEEAVQIDLEKNLILKKTPQERSEMRFIHKHIYKHKYKHVHHHIHIHVDDELLNSDNCPLFETNHTVTHTITHTNTQTQISSSFLG